MTEKEAKWANRQCLDTNVDHLCGVLGAMMDLYPDSPSEYEYNKELFSLLMTAFDLAAHIKLLRNVQLKELHGVSGGSETMGCVSD